MTANAPAVDASPPPAAAAPGPLEMFVRLKAPNESHLCARGLTTAGFVDLFRHEMGPLDVLVYRIPPDLLRADLWEPLTKEAENAVREKMGGIIVRAEDEWTLLWRADRAEPGRILRDGLEAPVELPDGYILRTTGEGLSLLARAWDGRGRFEWAGLRGLPRPAPEDILDTVHADLARLRVSIAEEVFLFAGLGGDARIVFTRREHLHRSIGALVRAFASGLARTPLSSPNMQVCERLAEMADGRGFSSSPGRDFTDKGRTIEVAVRTGLTPWSDVPPTGRGPQADPAKALLYYDRTSGIWAISS